MCEHCGCLSLRAVDELTSEHDAVLGHVRVARAAVVANDRELAADASRSIARILGPHTAVEEQALFPPMAREHPGHVGALKAEHVLIDAALGELADGPAVGPGWGPRLAEVLDLLSEHIKKEQDGLFPAALMTLTPGEWDQVEQVRARVGTALGSEPATT